MKNVWNRKLKVSICSVGRMRLNVRCLILGTSRLEENAKAWHLLYSIQIEVCLSPQLSRSCGIIAAAVHFWSVCLCLTILVAMVSQLIKSEGDVRSSCKRAWRAIDYGSLNNLKNLAWRSKRWFKVMQLIFENTSLAKIEMIARLVVVFPASFLTVFPLYFQPFWPWDSELRQWKAEEKVSLSIWSNRYLFFMGLFVWVSRLCGVWVCVWGLVLGKLDWMGI